MDTGVIMYDLLKISPRKGMIKLLYPGDSTIKVTWIGFTDICLEVVFFHRPVGYSNIVTGEDILSQEGLMENTGDIPMDPDNDVYEMPPQGDYHGFQSDA
ncbi:UNVERIFIED_CONTAM: hypothetical protein FKN15_028067 [Acipenser sinensis]